MTQDKILARLQALVAESYEADNSNLPAFLTERLIELEDENAMLKKELLFLAEIDVLVAKHTAAMKAKPNNLPAFNEIDKIEETILDKVLKERKGQ